MGPKPQHRGGLRALFPLFLSLPSIPVFLFPSSVSLLLHFFLHLSLSPSLFPSLSPSTPLLFSLSHSLYLSPSLALSLSKRTVGRRESLEQEKL